MFGIEFEGVVRFVIQASAGVAGAASFWGLMFAWKSRSSHSQEKAAGFAVLARRVMPLFLSALGVFLLSWLYAALFIFIPFAEAHEGISLLGGFDQIVRGFSLTWPLVAALAVVATIGAAWYFQKSRDLFQRRAVFLYGVQFLLLSVIISLAVVVDHWGREQAFFILHNFHSIFTLGTVIAVDFLFLTTHRDLDLKRVLYGFFPLMSAAIWIGLGMDFLSVSLIFDQAVVINAQFWFNQLVVGIIIVNGALLSGPVNKILAKTVSGPEEQAMTTRERFWFELAGSVSIVSWLTITFIDFFELRIVLWVMFAVYVLAIALAFAVQQSLLPGRHK